MYYRRRLTTIEDGGGRYQNGVYFDFLRGVKYGWGALFTRTGESLLEPLILISCAIGSLSAFVARPVPVILYRHFAVPHRDSVDPGGNPAMGGGDFEGPGGATDAIHRNLGMRILGTGRLGTRPGFSYYYSSGARLSAFFAILTATVIRAAGHR